MPNHINSFKVSVFTLSGNIRKTFKCYFILLNMSLDLLVVNPVYVENLGMFMRESQLSGIKNIFIQDKFNLLDEENRQRLIDWSSRVSYHNPPRKVDDALTFLDKNKARYRRIATVVDHDAEELFDFQYGENDLLVFGDERSGLGKELIETCDKKIYIPQIQPSAKKQKIQCRTLVSAQSMFLYQYMLQNRAK